MESKSKSTNVFALESLPWSTVHFSNNTICVCYVLSVFLVNTNVCMCVDNDPDSAMDDRDSDLPQWDQ